MFNSSVLDVAVGIVFVYLVLGLMCTTVNEWVAQALKLRAQTLKEGIRRLLNAPPDGTYLIRPIDINVPKLVDHMGQTNDKLADILTPVDAKTRELADVYQAQRKVSPGISAPNDLGRALVDRLNDALVKPDLYQRIDQAQVAPETLAEAQKQPKGNDLLRVNHALLHQAYPDEIAGLAEAFYNHPLIKSLCKPGEHPSYVPARTFALALADIIGKGRADVTEIQSTISAMPESDVKRSLLTLLRNADNQAGKFQMNLEKWYEDAMDRVSGWYKQKTQVITIVVAACITIFANADTVQIVQKLYLNPVVRDKIVQEASARRTPAAQPSATLSSALTPREKADLGQLTGWTEEFKTFHYLKAKRDLGMRAGCGPVAETTTTAKGCPDPDKAKDDGAFPGVDLVANPIVFTWLWAIIPGHLLGWLLTAIAASMGAPFWFDTLNKFMNVRAAGNKPGKPRRRKSLTN